MQQNLPRIFLLALAAGTTGCLAEDPPVESTALRDSPTCESINTVVVPLVAGQATTIGEVEVSLTGDLLHVRYRTDGDWLLTTTHVAVGETLADIPTNKPGCPKVGHFPWHDSFMPAVDEHEVIVDLAALGLDDADEIVIAAHADATSSTEGHEGAWADGPSFPGCPNIANYFTVDLRELRGLILWNKLGSAQEVTHSEIGPDGIIVGDVSYFPGQHGDGFRPDPRLGDHNIPDNFIQFEGLELGPQGSLEFWYQPDWVDYTVGHVVDIFSYGIPDDANNQHLYSNFNDWQNRFVVNAFDAGMTAYVSVTHLAPVPGWSTAQPFHVAVTWNGCAPVAADRAIVYINGVALPPGDVAGLPTFDDWLLAAELWLGSRQLSGDWDRHNWEGLDGVMDNIKIWDYPKTDFSDRFVE